MRNAPSANSKGFEDVLADPDLSIVNNDFFADIFSEPDTLSKPTDKSQIFDLDETELTSDKTLKLLAIQNRELLIFLPQGTLRCGFGIYQIPPEVQKVKLRVLKEMRDYFISTIDDLMSVNDCGFDFDGNELLKISGLNQFDDIQLFVNTCFKKTLKEVAENTEKIRLSRKHLEFIADQLEESGGNPNSVRIDDEIIFILFNYDSEIINKLILSNSEMKKRISTKTALLKFIIELKKLAKKKLN